MKTFPFLVIALLMCVQITFAQTPVLVADLTPGAASSFDFSNYKGAYLGNNIIFPASDGSSGLELFILKAGKISLLKDINPGQNGSSPIGFTALNGKLYFTAFNASNGAALWVTDGTTEGTQMVADVSPSTSNLHPAGLTLSKSGFLYFSVDQKLYRSNGTTQGTTEVTGASKVDLTPNSEYVGRVVCPYNNGIAFLTEDNQTMKLWKADDKAVLLAEIKSSSFFFDFYGLTQVKAGLAFGANSSFDDSFNGLYVYQAQNDTLIKLPINNKANANIGRTMVFNDTLLVGLERATGYFSTDGTPEGTQILSSSRPSFLVQREPIPHIKSGKYLFFRESEGTFSQNFSVTDGTKAGTKPMVSPEEPFTSEMISIGGYVFWAVGTSNNFSPEIWQGRPATRTATKLYTFSGGSPINSIVPLGVQDNKLYFISRMNANVGAELYSLQLNVVITSTKEPSYQSAYSLKNFGNQLTITSAEGVEKVQVNIYDLLGRKIKAFKTETGSTLEVNLPKNIYLVEAVGELGRFCQKAWIGQ